MLERPTNFWKAFAAATLLACAAFGKSPAEYRADVNAARRPAAEMLRDAANGRLAEDETRSIREIRERLPASVRVETEHGPQEVSNAWLHKRLDELVTERDPARRTVILADIEERLAAIAWKLDELGSAQQSGSTKDEEKRKLAEILRREEYQKPGEETESLFQRWLRGFLEWLESLFPQLGSPSADRNDQAGSIAWWLQLVIIIALAGLAGYGMYRFGPRLLPALRKREGKQGSGRVILGETIAHDRDAADIFAEAERLAGSGDIRGAVRKGYVALLCELSDRKVIGLARHKTNRDYLRDVRKRREIYDGMRGLTAAFERHWYGEKPTDGDVWERFRSGYREVVGRV